MDWKRLSQDTPVQIQELCRVAYRLYFSIRQLNNYSVFEVSGEKQLSRPEVAEKASEVFYRCVEEYERLKNLFALSVLGNMDMLNKVRLIPLITTISSSDDTGMKKELQTDKNIYMSKFKSDLKNKSKEINTRIEQTANNLQTGKILLINELRKFEVYIYDTILYAKTYMYREHHMLPYENRNKVKEEILNRIYYTLDNLEEAAKVYLMNEHRINPEKRTEFRESVILISKELTEYNFLEEKLPVELAKRPYLYEFMNRLHSGKEENFVGEKVWGVKLFGNYINIIRQKVDHAIESINLKDILIEYDKEKLNKLWEFPDKKTLEEFWSTYITAALQRSGVVPEIKEEIKSKVLE